MTSYAVKICLRLLQAGCGEVLAKSVADQDMAVAELLPRQLRTLRADSRDLVVPRVACSCPWPWQRPQWPPCSVLMLRCPCCWW
jgi:hypothetical protein